MDFRSTTLTLIRQPEQFSYIPYRNQLEKILYGNKHCNHPLSVRLTKWGGHTLAIIDTPGFEINEETLNHLLKRINKLRNKIIVDWKLKPVSDPIADGERIWSKKELNSYEKALQELFPNTPLQNPFDGQEMFPKPHTFANQILLLVNTIQMEIEKSDSSLRDDSAIIERDQNPESIVNDIIIKAQASLLTPLRNALRSNTRASTEATLVLAESREEAERGHSEDISRLQLALDDQNQVFNECLNRIEETRQRNDELFRSSIADLNASIQDERSRRIETEKKCFSQEERLSYVEAYNAQLRNQLNQQPGKSRRCIIS